MIGPIAGDIIGSRFDGGPAPDPGFDLLRPACDFTDHTVCALAVAEALMEGADIAATVRAFVRRHPHGRDGGLFRRWALSDTPRGYGSWGNGAVMRVPAVGWLARSEAEGRELAARQAVVSHNHPQAVAAAQALALAFWRLRRSRDASEVRRAIEAEFGYDLAPERALAGAGFDISAAGTAPPALAVALAAATWEEAVRGALGLGGDTDTLACIAGAVAEARRPVPPEVANRARALLTPDLRDVLEQFERRVSERARPGIG